MFKQTMLIGYFVSYLLLTNILQKGGFIHPYRHKKEPPGIAGGSSYAPVRLSYQLRPSRRSCDLTFAFLLLAARKRAPWVG